MGATASHVFAAGSNRSTELRLLETSKPPTAYSLPSIATTSCLARTVLIGATASHVFDAGSKRSTELRKLEPSKPKSKPKLNQTRKKRKRGTVRGRERKRGGRCSASHARVGLPCLPAGRGPASGAERGWVPDGEHSVGVGTRGGFPKCGGRRAEDPSILLRSRLQME